MNDEELLARCGEALKLHGEKEWNFAIPFTMAFQIASQLQLALRHPGNDGSASAASKALVSSIGAALRMISPDLTELLRRGDDRTHDVATVGAAGCGGTGPSPAEAATAKAEGEGLRAEGGEARSAYLAGRADGEIAKQIRVWMLGRLVEQFEHADRAIAIEVERGSFEPRTALAVLSEVRARIAEIGDQLDEVLAIHRTETAAQAAVQRGGGQS